MFNPFSEKIDGSDDDRVLVADACHGSQTALEKLILRHQAWIFNVAVKMVMDPDDAADITQEILVKMITGLASYQPEKGLFRTWLYRIVTNHVLDMKKRKFEMRISDFDTYVSLIEKLPDHRDFSHPDRKMLTEELKTGCMMGMLMCLNRKERLAFLLGAIFAVTDVVGADLMDISRDHFRKLLSRGRQKLQAYMKGICGQVDSNNPCRCENKIKTFLDRGMLTPGKPRFSKPGGKQVKDVITERLNAFDRTYFSPFLERFREQPFYDPPDMTLWLQNVIHGDEFRQIFNIH
ncbi:MAG TPA: RNA polymerase sigma factor [Smithellaceae bacterium]|nr:RNA polymerase sigma factor [Smithellaceae bacterium]HQM44353.1 RNA polymerase sigma factor [Smithellaceae bacterium]